MKKAVYPPLGLLTVAAMLPSAWEKKLVDRNVHPFSDKDLAWEDYVLISAMSIQRESVKTVLDRCRYLGVRVIAGGPLFTNDPEEFPDIDHLALNEAEMTLPPFLLDLRSGHAERRYTAAPRADITTTPMPLWELIETKHYASMNIQYSRGCPFDCEFCNITSLFGRIPRTIRPDQIISELEKILSLGWKGGVFFVDDNFIGNRTELKTEILPRIIAWMTMNNHPFFFLPEASINLADDAELIKMMVAAGFITVFVGIETTHEESLHECTNIPNRNRDLITSVRKIKSFGLEVQAGFIVGFDKDPATIFERMIEFIRESRIATAMVGLLKAPRGTKLYDCLITENRLMNAVSGDNTDFSINFIPKMNYESLMTGYKKIIDSIYSPRNYYARVLQFLKEYHPEQKKMFHMQWGYVKATVKSVVVLGLLNKERFHYWRLFFWSLFGRPRLFPLAITFSIYGFHFRRIFEQHFRTIENKGSTFSSS